MKCCGPTSAITNIKISGPVMTATATTTATDRVVWPDLIIEPQ